MGRLIVGIYSSPSQRGPYHTDNTCWMLSPAIKAGPWSLICPNKTWLMFSTSSNVAAVSFACVRVPRKLTKGLSTGSRTLPT